MGIEDIAAASPASSVFVVNPIPASMDATPEKQSGASELMTPEKNCAPAAPATPPAMLAEGDDDENGDACMDDAEDEKPRPLEQLSDVMVVSGWIVDEQGCWDVHIPNCDPPYVCNDYLLGAHALAAYSYYNYIIN